MLDEFATLDATAPYNFTGQPAIFLPVYWSHEGLPIGVQLVADYGRGDLLFQVAAQLEAARPWDDRYPTLYGNATELARGADRRGSDPLDAGIDGRRPLTHWSLENLESEVYREGILDTTRNI
jgi:Amidase